MKTVFPNLRLLLYVVLFAAGIVTLGVIQLYDGSDSAPQGRGIIVRDARVRVQLEAAAASANEVEDKQDKDFVDDKPEEKKVAVPKAVEKETVPEKSEQEGSVLKAPDDSDEAKREKIREMMRFAWEGYRNYSWGRNELKPIAKMPHTQSIFGGAGGATIIDGADTLFLMGLKAEYEQARDWIRDSFSIKAVSGQLSVFETTIRFIGGLLALHGLTGEQFYVEKAQEVADALLPAFNTNSGIAKSLIDPKTGHSSNYGWAHGGSSILAEFGTLHLEFQYLSELTGNPVYREKVQRIRDQLDKAEKLDGLFPNYWSPESGKSTGNHVSLGALGDSFYEYLIKSYLQTNKTDEQAKRMTRETSDATQKHMVFTSRTGLRYLAELQGLKRADHKMGHLACFAPGMYALEAVHETDAVRKEKVMQLAEDLANTCHESYDRTATKIGPEMFYFDAKQDATTQNGESGYILRPEVLEGFFYLWRLTGKQKYKDWVWDGISAIDKHCRQGAGFVGLRNVYQAENKAFDDVQQSFFLAETLKYAYLTFDDRAVPLDKFVFNTEAHPLPIYQPKAST